MRQGRSEACGRGGWLPARAGRGLGEGGSTGRALPVGGPQWGRCRARALFSRGKNPSPPPPGPQAAGSEVGPGLGQGLDASDQRLRGSWKSSQGPAGSAPGAGHSRLLLRRADPHCLRLSAGPVPPGPASAPGPSEPAAGALCCWLPGAQGLPGLEPPQCPRPRPRIPALAAGVPALRLLTDHVASGRGGGGRSARLRASVSPSVKCPPHRNAVRIKTGDSRQDPSHNACCQPWCRWGH